MKKISKPIRQVALSILAVYVVTSLHHAYGAWLYETPWRMHIAYQGFTWLIISYVLLIGWIKWPNKVLLWIFMIFSGFFFVGAIGFYEGLYNHVLKNLLFFSGFDHDILIKMYPSPKYELPNDWLFEITGILTFGVSLWCLKTKKSLIQSSGKQLK